VLTAPRREASPRMRIFPCHHSAIRVPRKPCAAMRSPAINVL